MQRIRADFDHLTDLLSDMNALTPEMHAANGFSTLIRAVERAMTENWTVSRFDKGTTQFDEISDNRSEQLLSNNKSLAISLEEDGYPLVTPQSMAEMMEFIRKPGWNHSIDEEFLKKLGIAPNNEPKVPYALRFLGIINGEGAPTKEFGELKTNYQATLKRLVKEKYADLFDVIPPDTATRKRVTNFFGKKQTDERRARFFIWICKEAGIELPNLDSDEAKKKSS